MYMRDYQTIPYHFEFFSLLFFSHVGVGQNALQQSTHVMVMGVALPLFFVLSGTHLLTEHLLHFHRTSLGEWGGRGRGRDQVILVGISPLQTHLSFLKLFQSLLNFHPQVIRNLKGCGRRSVKNGRGLEVAAIFSLS